MSHSKTLRPLKGTLSLYLKDWIREYFTPHCKYYDKEKNFHIWKPGIDVIPKGPRAYTNVGFGLLGYLVEQISNQSFDDYCTQHIIEPLDMKNTSYHLSDYDIDNIAIPYFWIAGKHIALPIYEIKNYAAGGLKSNICDLSHFLIEYEK